MAADAVAIIDKMNEMPPPESGYHDHFTVGDRQTLTECTINLKNLQQSFDRLEKTIRESNSPSQKDFRELEGRVRSIENFRWWIMGAALAGGAASHFLSKLLVP